MPPEVSIVVLTWNHFPFTRACLESVRRCTADVTYEIIVVDNASTDGTPKQVKDFSPDHLIINSENRGFSPANNQGLAAAAGKWVLFLNNDVIVTPGWLQGLLAPHLSYSTAGATGPMSNCVSGSQQLAAVPYVLRAPGDSTAALEDFARHLKDDFKSIPFNSTTQKGDHPTAPSPAYSFTPSSTHPFTDSYTRSNAQSSGSSGKGPWHEVFRLIGFCLLVRKSVLDKVGGFDEAYESGNFEDDDLCFRIRDAGYKLFQVEDTFVHHWGSVSFQDLDSAGSQGAAVATGGVAGRGRYWNRPAAVNPQALYLERCGRNLLRFSMKWRDRNPLAREYAHKWHLELARQAMAIDLPALALAHLDEALAINPGQADIWRLAGRIAHLLKLDPAKVKQYFHRSASPHSPSNQSSQG